MFVMIWLVCFVYLWSFLRDFVVCRFAVMWLVGVLFTSVWWVCFVYFVGFGCCVRVF